MTTLQKTLIAAALAVVVGAGIYGAREVTEKKKPAEAPHPSSHPVFGAIYESSAVDVSEIPLIRGPTGLLPRSPVYLVVGPRLLEWSVADVRPSKPSGYLYSWDPLSIMKSSNVWAFAVCTRPHLADLTKEDFRAVFCEAVENEKGRAFFGTNWIQVGRRANALLVKEGQVVLARHSSRPSIIYALEMTGQDKGNLRVRYLEAAH